MPLSVVHVAQPTDGGVAHYVADAAADQRARGWDVHACCPEDGGLTSDLSSRGVPTSAWEARRSPGPSVAGEAMVLRRLLRQLTPDVVHLHSSKAGLVGRLVLRGRVPTLFQPHGWAWQADAGPVAQTSIVWERNAVRWSRRLVCVGEAERKAGLDHGIRGDYVVVRNGVDLTKFGFAGDDARRAARQRLSIPAGAPIAVCVGRLSVQKGQSVLLDAWRFVRGRAPGAQLLLVGDGDEGDRLVARGVPGVTFVGGQDDVAAWYAAADVVVLPSRWGEGLPLTLLEALATGRSVVATDVGGMGELAALGAFHAIPPDDPPALADALVRRLTSPATAASEGRAGRQFAERELDLTSTLDQLAKVTQALVR